MEPQKRHVIFLGAGASHTSGYPVGDALRRRLSCPKQFKEDFGIGFGIDWKHVSASEGVWAKPFDYFKESVSLLRDGGFGTVDEYSRLTSRHLPDRKSVV